MDSYKLDTMIAIIYEDERLLPLSISEIQYMDGQTVFVIGDQCGYGKIDTRSGNIVTDEFSVPISKCGSSYAVYSFRPHNFV